ncbi:MAG: RdgB/HAM1 family non-canonical purine NTP pyrophosphatase [Vicinamibacterales bacterium]|nr:RdgB/HAM1 family non-canonical purine NTP pyrophosphatase [Vicinamibacterales bacterium]
MQTLLLATTNANKIREIRQLLGPAGVTLVDLGAFPAIAEPEETGDTFEANARLKAEYYAAHAGMLTVAEDSGLEIDALGGEPGVRSARFLRPDATYPERFAEIARRLTHVPRDQRTARFVCAIAVVDAGQVVFETRGTVEGLIADRPAGTGGFGYDPIFFHPPLGLTLAEAGDEKAAVSHRGEAFRRLAAWLTQPSGLNAG